MEVRNPRSGMVDYTVSITSHDEIAQRATAMRQSQQTTWFTRTMEDRCHAMTQLADALQDCQDSIIAALEVDTGRRKIAVQEVMAVIGSLRGWAFQAPQLWASRDKQWQRGKSKPQFQHQHQYVPYALVGIISPWNFPMVLSFIDAIPALAAGCAVMIKPSEVTPRFVDALMPAIVQAGMQDVLHFVTGNGTTTGVALIDHVDYVCFTGSVATGRKVAVQATRNLIPVNLELGGKDPLISTESADMEVAATVALRSSGLATGQACQSIEQVYVPQSHYEEFTRLLVEKSKLVQLNWPDIDQGHIGPFILRKQADIVHAQLEDARATGAQILCGGEIMNHGGGKGLEPTVLVDVNHDMEIMKYETFGPVIPVLAYNSVAEFIRLANDSDYGLSAAVFAGSIEEAQAMAECLDAGAITIVSWMRHGRVNILK